MELFSYAIVVLVAALVGLTIIQIVDTRLQDIQIRMPTITLPNIVVKVGDETLAQQGGAGATLCKAELHSNVYDDRRYKSSMTFVPQRSNVVPEVSNLRETPGAVEPVSPVTEALPQYYKDPKTMTEAQLIKFKRRGRLDKMSLVDYTNWLLAHKDEVDRLTPFHRGNLRILVRGGSLSQSDMPVVTTTPKTAQQQYDTMVPQSENIPQPQYIGYKPANFEEDGLPFIERSMDHLRYVNKDEPLKTWELTHFKNDNKNNV